MRFSPQQCEKEGCPSGDLPAFIVVHHSHGWMWVACAACEATKSDREVSVALPPPPEP